MENILSNKRVRNFIFEWIIPVLIAILASVLINRFVGFPFNVPTSSMYPAIKEGDFGIATRVYNVNNLKRGDVVIFKSEELNMILVKRLIGLPHDKIDIKNNGDIYVNGEKLDEPYVKNQEEGQDGQYEVPEGKFFFLGDNRSDSLDARAWQEKYIDKKFIEGKAQFILFPFNRISKL